jgi:hypothetical protein
MRKRRKPEVIGMLRKEVFLKTSRISGIFSFGENA